MLQVTGIGLLAIGRTWKQRIVRQIALRIMARTVARANAYVLVQNPDDLGLLRRGGVEPGSRFTVLGGAGVDPDEFAVLAVPDNPKPVAAFVGRMIHSKGVDTLMQAANLLAAQALPIVISLYGPSDSGNPEAIPEATLRAWSGPQAHWHGATRDVKSVWAQSDIYVLPARGGEGMPRAMLEAAACGRPLIVSDVPGCRHFVRDGIEGLIVPPDDPIALARALAKLAGDAALRHRMGEAARQRVLGGYTELHVRAGMRAAYFALAAARG
jgi:glycosyltransferase involved in cell wall biosynthesis